MHSNTPYKGARWFKCDLHLHTTASLCFQDKSITAKQWVNKAIEQGLDCVAVTDHNTGLGIDDIKNAAIGTSLVVFPGVEITCDTSKIHLLIIFDTQKNSADVRDFLVRAEIKAENFGQQDAATVRSIFDIVELAVKDKALVIPAHIDEYNGLESVGIGNLKKFYSLEDINAVQVVHKEFLDPMLKLIGNEEFKVQLNNYYGNPKIAIDDARIKEWNDTVKYAQEAGLAILTFSDNPHEPGNAKHGINGIGTVYTWIKMDEVATLEGLRQAFLLPQHRIKNVFDCTTTPYNPPSLWIKSITINNTTITGDVQPLRIEFNPQLNTIIGGRGSGKSSVLRFIRGLFNKVSDLDSLKEIMNDHNEFYKREQGRPKKGVLNENSVIQIEFVRNDTVNKITASKINHSASQDIKIERYNATSSSWELITDEGYIDFFEFEHYSQKQIYEIAQAPNALKERIDKAIVGIDKLYSQRELLRNKFLERAAVVRTTEQLLEGRGKIETKVKDLEISINKLKESGVADLLAEKEKFIEEEQTIVEFIRKLNDKKTELQNVYDQYSIETLTSSLFTDIYATELAAISLKAVEEISNVKIGIQKNIDSHQKVIETFSNAIKASEWKNAYDNNIQKFEAAKASLSDEQLGHIRNFENLVAEKNLLLSSLESVKSQLELRNSDLQEKNLLQQETWKISKEISEKRKEFVNSILQNKKIKVAVKQFRNQIDFEQRFRRILQRENNTFQNDVDNLMRLCFNGNVEVTIKQFKEIIAKIRSGEDVDGIVSGHFINLINSLNDQQIDEIQLLIPDDEIEILYKPTDTAAFKSLSTASAGQKTTSVLTFILSYGSSPLILDQPEDDLDNRLVYELIVESLKNAKENRQLIVVTHNANVPVNGDAEYIISMDTNSNKLNILNAGTVDQSVIKKEICDVMEGGEVAFEMRSKRYRNK